MFKVCTTTFYT